MSRVHPAHAPEVLNAIGRQAEWAARHRLALNRNGTGLVDREAGIFGGLHSDTRDQLHEGAGDELKRIHSLRSSTALAINVFQSYVEDLRDPANQALRTRFIKKMDDIARRS